LLKKGLDYDLAGFERSASTNLLAGAIARSKNLAKFIDK